MLYSEIVRRKMLNTVAGYLVVLITVLSVADLVLPGLPVPDGLYRIIVIVLVAFIPVVVALSWFFDITSAGIVRTISRKEFNKKVAASKRSGAFYSDHRITDPASKTKVDSDVHRIRSVAILPFTSSSTDADGEYLSDGLTETIINKLARLSDVRVIPRATAFRYKGSILATQDICRELRVESSVTGSINHYGDQLVVQAELVDAEQDSQIWGERYNAKWQNLFDVQEEIATKISKSLKPELSKGERDALKHRETVSLAAYKDYLQGRFLWNKRTPEDVFNSISFFRSALEKDPSYAVAYSGMADAYNILGYYSILSPSETYPLAKNADLKALEINPELSEAEASLGYATLFYDRDWEGANQHFKRSIELNPGYAPAHQWYAWYLLVMERFDEALVSFQEAMLLDPLALIINDHLSYGYMLTGQMEEARKQIERTRMLDPNYPLALWRLGEWHLLEGNLQQAVEAYSKAEVLRDGRYTLGYLGLCYAMMGRENDARHTLTRMDEYETERFISPLDKALVYAGLGENDNAFSFIDQARKIRVSDMVRFKLLPWPDNIKSDSRFAETVKALNLPI